MTARDEVWKELEADKHANSGFCSRRLKEVTACAVYVAVEKPTNRRALLAVGRVSPQFKLPQSRGLVVNAIEPSVGGAGTVTLAVVLRDPAFRDVFDVVVDDILRRLSTIGSELEAMEAVTERVVLWQTFLEKQGERGLGRAAQIGLFGELWLLRSLATELGWPRAIAAWTGPSGTNQDFQVGGVAFEVKTSSAKQHQRLFISSERQLDPTGLAKLYLFHLSIDERQGSGETLPMITADICKRAASHPLALASFTDRLILVGYSDAVAHLYRDTGYTEREHNFLLVGHEFPRIIESDLRKGVGDVHYTIGVAACLQFKVRREQVNATLKEAGNGN